MKLKMLTALAAITLTAGGAYAASEMKGCCQGEECCCEKMDKPADKDAPAEAHQH